MCSFTEEHHLGKNKDVHNLIQNFQMITLNSIHTEAPELLKKFYAGQRQTMNTKWTACLALNGLDIRKQLRDVHLLLPLSWAIPYLKLLFHFL